MQLPSLCLLAGLIVSVAKPGLGGAGAQDAEKGSPLPSTPTSALEKAGLCPPGRNPDAQPSKVFCLSDASCPGSEKCCNVGTLRICAHPAMVSPGYCPKLCSGLKEACQVSCLDDTWCGPGEKCCPDDCHMRCVAAAPVRPGICPRRMAWPNGTPCRNQCEDDRDCPEDQKCCFAGCGLECLNLSAENPAPCSEAPAETTPKSCIDFCRDNFDCPAGEKCISTDCGFKCSALHPAASKTNTVTPKIVGPTSATVSAPGQPGKGPILSPPPAAATKTNTVAPRLVGPTSATVYAPGQSGKGPILTPPPAEAERPGACPVVPPNAPQWCWQGCRADSECPGARKCCWNGCARVCLVPLLVKPGACPLQLRGSMGPCPEPSLKNCSHDFDCEGTKKCCSISCTNVCKEAEEVRPGTCPLQAAKSQEPDCSTLTFCVRDNDCSGPSEKCCWLSCGWVCLAVTDSPAMEPPTFSAEAQTELGAKGAPTLTPLLRKTEKPTESPISAAKPGHCRESAYKCGKTMLTYECKSDSSCSGTMKCCLSGCSWKCVEPGVMTKKASVYRVHK
ncbi:keratin-associated protein 10-7-like [Podarcis lilfordi]|uniref:Keratin-associated protein 10-7-like n=2 Tax=Podarcis lilfordi TaxID=74358 RepID=A0AA35PAY8_9SAUR|nr:keratin-associated protein 10-7-like [Podarcis lilfordi]